MRRIMGRMRASGLLPDEPSEVVPDEISLDTGTSAGLPVPNP